jgi:ketosteroid isomerase-like protein
MKQVTMLVAVILLLAGCSADYGSKVSNKNTEATIIAMERAALDRWIKGDPSGFLEISSSDVVYFDPQQEIRLDGIEALTRLYESIRGKVNFDHYEMLNPKVQLCGDMAVLTFNFVTPGNDKFSRWNCTEVYCRKAGQWRIIQTHWSVTQPFK